ncbi:MAG: hypothetical protein KDA21_11195 [Phycisphaerales bacterium]|nr:hypothetical protein [Phycisphaerales bacterium]
MRWMILTLLGAAFGGCVSHDYMGESYAPTEHVRVFYDAASVPDGFSVIGEDRAEASEFMSSNDIVADMVKKAREVGADAILIDGVQIVDVGSTTSTSGESSSHKHTQYYASQNGKLHKRHKKDSDWHESSYTTEQHNKVITAQFLKRK